VELRIPTEIYDRRCEGNFATAGKGFKEANTIKETETGKKKRGLEKGKSRGRNKQ
jgi:hypothetical protein